MCRYPSVTVNQRLRGHAISLVCISIGCRQVVSWMESREAAAEPRGAEAENSEASSSKRGKKKKNKLEKQNQEKGS